VVHIGGQWLGRNERDNENLVGNGFQGTEEKGREEQNAIKDATLQQWRSFGNSQAVTK